MAKPIRIANYNIADGEAGIMQTVDYMWNYALRDSKNPLILAKVKQLTGNNRDETLKNIYNYVIKTVKYMLDPPEYEMITAPIHYVNGNRNTGDCDCMTTLLVCLLEAAGFETAITVIAWRMQEYTHVYAEVKRNGKWFILDPTLEEDGFGQQDKKIIRQKRIEKKDMAKLTVLADGNEKNKQKIPCIPSIFRGGQDKNCCCNGKDDNKNTNNININFGTNVENSHNNASKTTATNTESHQDNDKYNLPQPVHNLPSVTPPTVKTIEQEKQPTVIVVPNGNSWHKEVVVPNTNEDEYEYIYMIDGDDTLTQQHNVGYINQTRKQIITSERPKTIIKTKNRKPSYPEFP